MNNNKKYKTVSLPVRNIYINVPTITGEKNLNSGEHVICLNIALFTHLHHLSTKLGCCSFVWYAFYSNVYYKVL